MIVTVNHELYLFGKGLFCVVGIDEFLLDGIETIFAHVLVGNALLREVVALLVYCIVQTLAKLFVVHLVAVFAFLGLAGFHGQFGKYTALYLDGFVCGFQRSEHTLFADFLHLAFNHHDVVLCCGNDKVEIGAVDVLHRGVDDIFAVKIAYAYFADGAVEGYVAHGKCRGCCQCCQLVGHGVLVARNQGYLYLHFGMEIVGEKRTQGTVYKACNQNLVFRRTGLTLEKTPREATHGGIFFLIVNGEWHEIHKLSYFFLRTYGGQQHGVVHAHHCAAVGLLGQFAGLDFDHAAIAEIEFLCDDVHCFFYCFICLPQPWGPSPGPYKKLNFKYLSSSTGV